MQLNRANLRFPFSLTKLWFQHNYSTNCQHSIHFSKVWWLRLTKNALKLFEVLHLKAHSHLMHLKTEVSFGLCGFRPFDFHSILKIENQNFTIMISNVWFLKNSKSKIYNLSFQCLLLRKVKLNIIPQYFENQKLKIENGQLVVLTFCFQFPLPKIQAIKNSNLTKQFMCNCVTAGWNTK